LSVLVIDEARAAGGRVYRVPDSWLEPSGSARSTPAEGAKLCAALASCGAELALDHTVWHVGRLPTSAGDPPRFEVSSIIDRHCVQARSRALIVATGALERFYPRPGWTLPGVIGLGAATVMLKSSGVLPGKRVVVAGPGPLAVWVAKLVLDAGGSVAAVCDPNPRRAWTRLLPALARQAGPLVRGGAWLAQLALAGVPILRGWDVRAIHRERQVERITLGRVDRDWRPRSGGEEKTLDADALCIGYGLAPATDLYQLLGAALHYEPARGGWAPLLDRGQRCTMPGLYGAGDGAGVLGAVAAPATGRIAALSAARDLGRLDDASYRRRIGIAQRALARAASFGSAMAQLAQPNRAAVAWVPDSTIVCRCEDVRAGELRAAIAAGVQEINALKAATRCGMGPCGGRVCGEAAGALLECAGFARERIGQLTARAPLRPVPLSALTGSFEYGDIPFPRAADT
jgi:thioredoxin reductase/bacterioferritin-associated ferredoxin